MFAPLIPFVAFVVFPSQRYDLSSNTTLSSFPVQHFSWLDAITFFFVFRPNSSSECPRLFCNFSAAPIHETKLLHLFFWLALLSVSVSKEVKMFWSFPSFVLLPTLLVLESLLFHSQTRQWRTDNVLQLVEKSQTISGSRPRCLSCGSL